MGGHENGGAWSKTGGVCAPQPEPNTATDDRPPKQWLQVAIPEKIRTKSHPVIWILLLLLTVVTEQQQQFNYLNLFDQRITAV